MSVVEGSQPPSDIARASDAEGGAHMQADELAIHGGPRAVTVEWQRDWPLIGTEEVEAVVSLMNQGILSIYDRSGIIAEFEDAFADYHRHGGNAPFAIAHNSGTSALHAAYFGLGIGPGDEVVVPTYTFLATVVPLLQCGARPVFADMDPLTLNISPESVAERIGSRTRAIVATHMWGHPADMPALLKIGDRHGLPVVEDCSHAHGATIDGRKVGTFGVAACFSLEGHKPIVAGEGGVLITPSRRVYERALMLGHFGRRIKDEVTDADLRPYVETGFGHKYRMHPLAAAIANQQLRRLDGRNKQRAANLELLASLLESVPGIRPPVTVDGTTRGGWYGFKPSYVSEELGGLPMSSFMAALRAEGVQVKKPGSPPLHTLPLFGLTRSQASSLNLPWAESLDEQPPPASKCPTAEETYPRLLSLPTFSGSCEEVIRQYAEAFMKVAASWRRLL
jgi:perosamine synthetase